MSVQIYVPRETYLPCIPLFSNVVNTSNFPDFCTGLYTIAPYPPVAHACPQPRRRSGERTGKRISWCRSCAVNTLKILESTAFKRMPYESMAYKTMETDSKSGSESGLTIDRCHILNDNALSKRRYIHREKARPVHNLSTTKPICGKFTTSYQIDNKLSTGY